MPPGRPPPGGIPPPVGLVSGPPLPLGASPLGLVAPSPADLFPFWSCPGGEAPDGVLGFAPKGRHSRGWVSAVCDVLTSAVDSNGGNGIDGTCVIPGGVPKQSGCAIEPS